MAFSRNLKIFALTMATSLVCLAQGGRHAPAQQVDDSSSMSRGIAGGLGNQGGSLPGFSRGAVGQNGQQQGQGQGQGQGATGGGGGGGGGGGASVPESPNRKKADKPLEIAQKAEENISKGTEKATAAIEKLQQSFSSSLASLKPPEDDKTIMKNLGDDLAKRSEESAKAPPIAGDITEAIVKSYQELSNTFVDTFKQKAVTLAPPPGQPLQAPPPPVTVGAQLAAFSGGSNKRTSASSLVTADAATSPSALIPSLQSGGGGRSDRLGAVEYGAPVRGITGPTLNSANSAVAESINTSTRGFADNNFSVAGSRAPASTGFGGGGRGSIGGGTSSIFSNFPSVGTGPSFQSDEDEGVEYYDRRKSTRRGARKAVKGSRGVKKTPGESTASSKP